MRPLGWGFSSTPTRAPALALAEVKAAGCLADNGPVGRLLALLAVPLLVAVTRTRGTGHEWLFWLCFGLLLAASPWLPDSVKHGIWRENWEATQQRVAAGKPERGDLVAVWANKVITPAACLVGIASVFYGIWRLTGQG
jgi:hypothetical protein